MRFAINAASPAILVDQLMATMAHAPVNWHWFLLIDSAFDYHEPDDVTATPPPYAASALSLYQHEELAGLQAAAPVLYPVAYEELCSEAGKARLQQILAFTTARPMLSVLASSLEIGELIRYWEPYHFVRSEEGQRYLLRMADTRVSASLPRILATEQWAALSHPLLQWRIIDRQGKWLQLRLPNHQTNVISPPLLLSDKQQAALLASAEPDTVFDFIQAQQPDLIPAQPATCYAWLQASSALARQYQIEGWPEIVDLGMMACMTHGASNQELAIINILKQRKYIPGQLLTALLDAMPGYAEV